MFWRRDKIGEVEQRSAPAFSAGLPGKRDQNLKPVPVASAEELAAGNVAPWRVPAIAVDADAQQTGPCVFVVGCGQPNMGDDSKTSDIRDETGLAGHNPLVVAIAAEEAMPLEERWREKCLFRGRSIRPDGA